MESFGLKILFFSHSMTRLKLIDTKGYQRLHPPTNLYGVTSRKTVILILNIMRRTSNLT
jgi:hypothetical protein